MILHDPQTEKKLHAMAGKICGNRGFERPDTRWWTRLPTKIFAFATPLGVAFMFLAGFGDGAPPVAIRQMIFTVMAMLLIRSGIAMLVVSAQKCGLYTVLVNLPVTRQVAFGYVRSRFFRKFFFVAVIYSCVLLAALDGLKLHTDFYYRFPLLFGVGCGTIALYNSRWFVRLKIVKIWYAAGALVIAYLLFLHFSGFDSKGLPNVQVWFDRLLWIFPPAWILQDRMASGGLALAVIWSAWGLWSWIRWPSALSPGYDKPNDFVTAFGGFSQSETLAVNQERETQFDETIEFETPLTQTGKGWVNRLAMWSISPGDRAVAGAMLDPGKGWSKSTNFTIILAPLWVLACMIGAHRIPADDLGDLIRIMEWIIPITFMVIVILPHSNSIQRATNPYPLGTGHVPFFCTLPVSIRSLLRISQRVTIVRSLIFGIIATPLFWGLAMTSGKMELAAGLLGAIPAFTVVWCFSRPVLIWHRIQAAIKRRRGIFLLHCATGSVEVALFFLWLAAGFCGVGAAYVLAAGGSEPLLAPVALRGIVLNAVFSRIILEIAINEIRHRRYDWVAKLG